MIKIMHIITGLGNGGAEHMLYKLLKYSDKSNYYHEVISLLDEGTYGNKIQELDIKVHCLNLNKKNVFLSILQARKITKKFDVVDTWLYHADIFGFLVAKILLRKKLIWNIRHSNLDKDANKPRTLKIVKINSILSRCVNLITYNSTKAFENHVKFGYVNKEYKIIPNGFELDKYKFILDDRNMIRQKMDIKHDEKVIITVGRWDIQKDYYTLLKALNELKSKIKDFIILMVGTNLDQNNNELLNLIDEYNLKANIILLGRQDNIPALLGAADIYVSSSLGESFSNAIGEAMACELPCVVTDVGDSKIMVGDTGKVIEAKNYKQLSSALFDHLVNNNLKRNKEARKRIISMYSITEVSKKFEENYDFNF